MGGVAVAVLAKPSVWVAGLRVGESEFRIQKYKVKVKG